MSNHISMNLLATKQRISAAELEYDRQPGSVQLVAVSKTFPVEAVRAAYAVGQRLFGENYVQEFESKIHALGDLPIEWHFIGPIQSNKSRIVAENADWVHSVDRLKIAERLSSQRPAGRQALNVCLQVNVSGEPSKSGCSLDEVGDLAAAIVSLSGVKLRGLMCIPAPDVDQSALSRQFMLLRAKFDALNAKGMCLDTLSMGMSADLEWAIQAGATFVRIGTAIFGAREYYKQT